MSLPDQDRYYTPPALARRVVEYAESTDVIACLDSTCGNGDLLSAAAKVFPEAQILGIDVDRSAIAKLRDAQPSWVLSCGDALSRSTWDRTRAAKSAHDCDLVVLNPPFSMQFTKGVRVGTSAFSGRASVAMAHVLVALEATKPTVCCAIVPESMLHSDVDSAAREVVDREYRITGHYGLKNTTFRGTRANAVVIRMVRRRRKGPESSSLVTQVASRTKIIRGGLQLFEAEETALGLPFVHTTDIPTLIAGSGTGDLRRVCRITRGTVSGHVVLIPRVGEPRRSYIQTITLKQFVQLSDCVIALRAPTKGGADEMAESVRKYWRSFRAQYRGTGARYITVARLREWVDTHRR